METNAGVDRDLPETVRGHLTAFCERLRGALGDSLISVIVYGDLVKGEDFDPGRSDVNVMVVLSEVDARTLDRAVSPVTKGARRWRLRTFVVSEDDLRSSTDVFPIKFLDMQKHHRLLCGKDVLADLSISREHLRLRCEQEIKNILLRLHNVYLHRDLRRINLRHALSGAASAFLNSLSAALDLKTGGSPTPRREIAAAAAREFGLDATTLAGVLDLLDQTSKPNSDELRALYDDFMATVHKAAHAVDQLQGGAGP